MTEYATSSLMALHLSAFRSMSPFIDAISTGTFIPEADINQDGVVDLLDVSPFVELMKGNLA